MLRQIVITPRRNAHQFCSERKPKGNIRTGSSVRTTITFVHVPSIKSSRNPILNKTGPRPSTADDMDRPHTSPGIKVLDSVQTRAIEK
jgi:hypothetical protein